MSKLEIGDFVEVFRMPTSPKVWSLKKSESIWGRIIKWSQGKIGVLETEEDKNGTALGVVRLIENSDPSVVYAPMECLRKVVKHKRGKGVTTEYLERKEGKFYLVKKEKINIEFIPEEPF